MSIETHACACVSPLQKIELPHRYAHVEPLGKRAGRTGRGPYRTIQDCRGAVRRAHRLEILLHLMMDT